MSVTFADIERASRRLAGFAAETPLIESPLLNVRSGGRVLVKAECLQRTGSFKFRGAWNAVSQLDPARHKGGVVAYSSGNHAQGVAAAAQIKGLPALIVMPADTPEIKQANTRSYGAEVVTYDRAAESREAIAERHLRERGAVMIPPFDHPDVIAGQGTAGLELAEEAARRGVRLDDVLVCCSGGGLTAGVALALEGRFRVRPAEPAGFDDVARSLVSGRRERNAAAAGSVCDAIVTPSPGEITFPILQRLCGPGLVVSDDEALRAMVLAFSHLRIVLEPGGAVALAAALFRPDLPDTVIAVASGGNVDPALFGAALARFGG